MSHNKDSNSDSTPHKLHVFFVYVNWLVSVFFQYVDDYIHRSGRTGRAQRTGVCVCFYKRQEEWDLGKVERQAVSQLTLLCMQM